MSPRTHTFDSEESQFLQALGQQIALAIENAQLYGATAEMNAHLQEEIEERNRAEKTFADFTAMVVHDLRSPLSNVVSIAESLQDGLFGQVNEQQNKWLWKIENNCKGLIEHVSDFLDLSKIEAGHIELIKKAIDLRRTDPGNLGGAFDPGRKRQISLRSQIDCAVTTDLGGSPPLQPGAKQSPQQCLKFSDDGGDIEVGAGRVSGKTRLKSGSKIRASVSTAMKSAKYLKIPPALKRKKLRSQGNRPGISDL